VLPRDINRFDNNNGKLRNIMDWPDNVIADCLVEEISEGMMFAWCRKTERMIRRVDLLVI
jgi:hypothetical protein